MDKQLQQLNTLIEMTALVTSSLEPLSVRQLAIESAVRLLDAEAGSLLLIDNKTDELYFEVATGEKENELTYVRFKNGLGIAGWAAVNRKPAMVADVSLDERFYMEVDEVSGFTTKSMICVPVMDKEDILGVLQVINKKDGEFENDDMLILQTFANQVGIAMENAKLFQEAITDGHTGLYHHKYFKLRLKEEIDRSRRYDYPLAVLLLDIDLFKKVNDRYGHPVGSMVIERIAEILKSITRVTDVAARYGGEEFAMILPYASYQYGLETAERLRSTIEKSDFDGIEITVSVGVGHYDGKIKGATFTELISITDGALYSAKEKGRNRVEGAFYK